jgi:aminopeptidase N
MCDLHRLDVINALDARRDTSYILLRGWPGASAFAPAIATDNHERIYMSTGTSLPIYREGYRPPNFWIRNVDLHFDLDPARTIVSSKMAVQRNDAVDHGPLQLDGEGLELLGLTINGANVPYRLVEHGLVIDSPPDGDFIVEIRNACAPATNTALSGLYLSNGNFCTQCEAQGFRRITYFLDRPDVMAIYTVTIRADRDTTPVLLSNGNRSASGRLSEGRHYAVWTDPYPKPSYLFALIGGDFATRSRRITTRAGGAHLLEIYVNKADLDKTEHAMNSLVAAIQWDEQRFGLPLDLERFMLVGVPDFNAGAMENKGLNIFNTAALLASRTTATDTDYEQIQTTVAHEYFHNWTGNRVTCRDWFQLSLKEGLTVFRHQEFTMDIAGTPSARAACRIRDTRLLRSLQFPEDSGSMAHPVRPDSYNEISNFYTATVYGKGAELVRMIQTLVGRAGFEAGLRLYFERHDGQAVTCDDFAAAMADANPGSPFSLRLESFKRWYAQAGTPHVTARGHYDASGKNYTLQLSQHTPPTPGQSAKVPLVIPITLGLLDEAGRALPLVLRGEAPQVCGYERVVVLEEAEQTFVFEQVPCPPVPSLLRGFCAPVALDDGLTEAELLLLLRHDSDPYNRWEAGQRLLLNSLLSALRRGDAMVLDAGIVDAMRSVLEHTELDAAFKELVLTVPDEAYIAEQLEQVDPAAIHAVVMAAQDQLAAELHDGWSRAFEQCRDTPGKSTADLADPGACGRRALANLALSMLVRHSLSTGASAWPATALQRFEASSNMTERLGALSALVNAHHELGAVALDRFLAEFRHEELVVDKWFAIQARAPEMGGLVFHRVLGLLRHDDFNLHNPNRARSLLGGLCLFNPGAFHRADGSGYETWAQQLLALDALNPQLAGRLARAMDRWTSLVEPYRGAARRTLENVAAKQSLSADVREIVQRALEADLVPGMDGVHSPTRTVAFGASGNRRAKELDRKPA